MSIAILCFFYQVVLDVACLAVTEKKTTLVGVLYDEIVRQVFVSLTYCIWVCFFVL